MDDSAVPPYGSDTMRLLSDGDIILHWNSPWSAVYLDSEGPDTALYQRLPASSTAVWRSAGRGRWRRARRGIFPP